ncbi:MAG: glycosyl hydrolase family 95 catalytic domain-containing protein [Bacteroidaceae bacterium]
MKYIYTGICLLLLFGPAKAVQRDSKLWYAKSAIDWNHALPVGNGRLGAMVYGGWPRETIQLNEESLWAGCKTESDADAADCLPQIQKLLLEGRMQDAAAIAEKSMRSSPLRIRSYQPFGNLYADFYERGSLEDYRRELDLETGIASTSYRVCGVAYRREVFVSAVDNIVVVRFAASCPGTLTFRLRYDREQDATARALDSQTLAVEGQIYDFPSLDTGPTGFHMRFAGLIRGFCQGGSLQACSDAFYVENADEATFYLTIATDYGFDLLDVNRGVEPLEFCQSIMNTLGDKSYDAIYRDHVAEHSGLMNRVCFNMGEDSSDLPTDERLLQVRNGSPDLGLITLYFQYGRYLLMSSSRSPGVLPANLQGIWNKDMEAVWNSDFHTNINIQMNYWPAEVCNLSETFLPFSHFIQAVRAPGRVTARKTFNAKGWTMNHVSDPFGRTAISDGVGWGTFPMAGPWVVLHLWEHYRYTGDRAYLEQEAYPCMKESAEFVLSFLVKDKNGYLVTAPSNSPENRYLYSDGKSYSLTYGATMDIEIIRELFEACLGASKVIKTDAAFDKRVAAALVQLPPIRIGKRYDTIQEWIEDYEEVEPGHRHISHLFGLYPGTSIQESQKELFEAARRTLARRRYYNEVEQKGSYTGWSRAWMINFYARLKDGEEAGKNVELLLAKTTQDNLFNVHPPFQIDGNFGGIAGIAEMLLQSHAEAICLLPALPESWRDGEVRGLCARGGITVDMSWENALLQKARFYSRVTQKVKVDYRGRYHVLHLKAGVPYDWKLTE